MLLKINVGERLENFNSFCLNYLLAKYRLRQFFICRNTSISTRFNKTEGRETVYDSINIRYQIEYYREKKKQDHICDKE